MITSEQYLELSARSCKEFPDGIEANFLQTDILHAVLGIAGEAGELVDAFKKHLIYGKLLDIENVREEAGDILWYMALLLRSINSSFEEVMQMNIDKLMIRYPDRYTDQHAITRADKKEGE